MLTKFLNPFCFLFMCLAQLQGTQRKPVAIGGLGAYVPMQVEPCLAKSEVLSSEACVARAAQVHWLSFRAMHDARAGLLSAHLKD